MSKRWIPIFVIMLLTLPPAINTGNNSFWKVATDAHAGPLRSKIQSQSNTKQAQPTVQKDNYSTAPPAGAAPGAPPTPATQAVPQTAAPSGAAVPVGTVVQLLPKGCTTVATGGVSYSNCGGTYYRAAFQGSTLVYVAVEKP